MRYINLLLPYMKYYAAVYGNTVWVCNTKKKALNKAKSITKKNHLVPYTWVYEVVSKWNEPIRLGKLIRYFNYMGQVCEPRARL